MSTKLISTNLNPSDPNSMLLSMYRAGGSNRKMAEATEAEAASKGLKLFSLKCEEWLDKYVGNHPSVLELKQKVRHLAIEDDPVLIIGPTGTGKELIARALHGRRPGKFEAINCTALPAELLESELFGHVKGAYTGAVEDRIGKFRAASLGTLFLDEIGDMPIEMQAKLLRVLQEKVVTPLGSDKSPEPISCRIIAATNVENLHDSHKFRDDLWWRLSTFTLRTLAIADRDDDWIEIMDSLGGEKLAHLICAERAKRDLDLNFEGGVREIQAMVRRYQVFGELPFTPTTSS